MLDLTNYQSLGAALGAAIDRWPDEICLIESEASMANRLEEVCVADKYKGSLLPELVGLPYLVVKKGEHYVAKATRPGTHISIVNNTNRRMEFEKTFNPGGGRKR